jgi:DNA-directed RNA polymerase III subunit RPC8
MFQLASLCDDVRIAPKYLGSPLPPIVKQELMCKYANRVIYGLGLAITIQEVSHIGDPIVHPGIGAPFVRVSFNLIVFRPFEYEILVGKIRSANETGISISMEFFEDIFLPSIYMQQKSYFDPKEQLWYWEHESGERAYMDLDQSIRFRVYADQFIESPSIPKETQMAASMVKRLTKITQMAQQSGSSLETQIPASNLSAPYIVYASIAEQGLGLLSWWDSSTSTTI